jgi:lactoylglutathione lyase
MGLVKRLNVVYLYVRDLDRSLAFYRDVLGIPIERDAHNPDWAEARFPDGMRFALHPWHEGVPEIGSGSVMIDFEVEDLDEALARLREAGVEVGEPLREPWGSVCSLIDPDGYRIDLFQPPAR